MNLVVVDLSCTKLFFSGEGAQLHLNLETALNVVREDSLTEHQAPPLYIAPETQYSFAIVSSSMVYSLAMTILALEFGQFQLNSMLEDKLVLNKNRRNALKIQDLSKMFDKDEYKCENPTILSQAYCWLTGWFWDNSVYSIDNFEELIYKMLEFNPKDRGDPEEIVEQLSILSQ